MSASISIRSMKRSEVDDLVSWASQEGWNPGLDDAEIFWHTDPDAFVAAEYQGALIGGGAITGYGGQFGFMGFFIIKPEYRGVGFGDALWQARKNRLLARLHPGATVGLDGVFAMQPYYAKGGFKFSHRNLRFGVHVPACVDHSPMVGDNDIRPLADLDFNAVQAYDGLCFPAPRPRFLSAWIQQRQAMGLGAMRNGCMVGYGVVRKCEDGHKIGPLFADDLSVARDLFASLRQFARGGMLYIDAPESHPQALELASEAGMKELFGCARMYLGPAPITDQNRIFGVTTFELG